MTVYTSNADHISTTVNGRVVPGVTIGSPGKTTGIVVHRPALTFQLDGLAYGSGYGVYLDTPQDTTSLFSLTVGVTGGASSDHVGIHMAEGMLRNFGSVFGATVGVHIGLDEFSESSAVYNYGTIIGNEGIKTRTTEGTTIKNSGRIVGDAIGVHSAGTAVLTLSNTPTGTIMAPTAVRAGDTGDSVVNMGLIDGAIHLGGGADTYDGALGKVVGTIGMESENDIATGGVFADTIDGGDGDDILDGGAGNDKLIGDAGNDTFYVDSRLDQVVEAASGGDDTVYASVDYVLHAGEEIEHLIADPTAGHVDLHLTGNSFANGLVGNGQVNKLDGRGGADTMSGLGGNDTYYVDDIGDTVIEAIGGGSDTVFTTLDYALAAGQEIEELRADPGTGTMGLDLTGNEFANTLIGDAGDNTLDGGAGADWMRGGLGDDTYIVDNLGDVVTEKSNGGNDTVQSGVTFTLAAQVENLTLTGSANIDGTGNTLANQLSGNGGKNTLAGKAGNDTLTGGAGNDLFLFDTTRNATTNLDTVTDFTAGADQIGLDARTFKLISAIAGTLDDANFAAGSPTTKDQHILYDNGTGVMSYDQDGSGTRYAAVAFAQVTPGTALTASDFRVI